MFYVRNILLNCVFIFLLTAPGFTQELSEALMYDQESAKVLYMNEKDGLLRAQSSYTIERMTDDQMPIYEMTSQGAGQYDRHKDIVFTRTAKMMEKDGRLQILYSKITIKNKRGNLVAEYVKTYDYTDQKVVFRRFNANRKLVERETFNIKGPVCDDVTLVYFLKTYAMRFEQKDYQDFYLLTNEPKMYHVRLIDKGEEAVALPLGDFQARKFQLMADLGSLTEWVAKFVPKTYIWYKSEFPHDRLQYEGMERGYQSDKILVHYADRNPSLD